MDIAQNRIAIGGELVAELYIIDKIELKEYKKIFKTLLLLNSESARQIPFVQAYRVCKFHRYFVTNFKFVTRR